MIWTRTNDSARTPSHWTELIQPGQFAVFIFDAPTHVARDSEGAIFKPAGTESIALCDNFPEALAFASGVVAIHPELCCEVYDDEGKSKEPRQTVYNPAVRSKYEGRQYAKRQALWGSLVVVCGVAFAAYDFTQHFTWIWGYVIGAKLTVIGGFRMFTGLFDWYERRHEV